jgi:hypothetical protein
MASVRLEEVVLEPRYSRLTSHELLTMRFNIDASSAVIVCLCMAAAYVGVLYTLPSNVRRLPRDHPTHVRLPQTRRGWSAVGI